MRKNNQVTDQTTLQRTQPSWIRALQILLAVGMGFMVLAIINIGLSRNGVGVFSSGPMYGQPVSVRGDLITPLDVGDVLKWTETDNGTVDAATGMRPAEFSPPFNVGVSWPDPSGFQRVGWVIREISGAMLALAGTWLVYQIVRSTRLGDPFTQENVKRLRLLAFVVAVGGTAQSLISQAIGVLMLQRSAAQDLFAMSIDFSFLPIIAGSVLAVLAGVWSTGVELRNEVEGMV